MKLRIESVKIKNFLSFGSVENEIPFKEGVNIVLGKDVTTGRSNGAGKSSFLESIPYALFGQTHKGIKKEQLVNWKSRKGCRVELAFKIGETPFRVVRGIKPDIFEIYDEDQLIDKPPHVRDYQKILEDIIGLNFNTFVSLIHSNINSSNRILSMKALEKRKFMEDVFGLDVYSKLIEKANEKIRSSKEKLNELTLYINSNDNTIETTESQIKEINNKMKKFGSSEIEFNDAQEDLTKLLDRNPDIEDKLEKLDKEVMKVQEQTSSIRSTMMKIENKTKLVNRWIRDINNSLAQVAESEKKSAEYFDFIKEVGDIHTIVDRIDSTKVEIAKLESELDVKVQESRKIDLELAGHEAIQDFECPKCGYSGQEHKKEITVLKRKLTISTKKWQKIKDQLQDHKGKRGELEQKRDWLLKMQESLRTDVDPEKIRMDKLRYAKVVFKLNATYDELEKWLDMSEKTGKLQAEARETLRLKKLQIDNQKQKVQSLETKIRLEEQARDEFQAIIKTNKDKIKETKKENVILVKKQTNIKSLIDYFELIKEICKDDNIKQYAISSIMPYLNQQTNYYLSEVGYGFYAIIDKWLQAEIKGPGVTKASYGSLSGGEARGIDLAIQFALLDIARIQAGRWPDILIMDEILDSSVDSKGISKLVDIIRAKQQQEGNKIFVISHREEIGDEFEADSQYFVTKDRYSKVEVV